MDNCIIRRVEDRDRAAVTDIFNYFVENSYAAYPDKKVGRDFLDLLRGMARNGILYVIEDADNNVIGFGMLRSHQPAEAFNHTCEITYFILPEFCRQGLGSRLLKTIEHEACSLGVKTLLANISSLNGQSLSFHLKNGFTEVGRFKKVGRKFCHDFDVVWMQKFL